MNFQIFPPQRKMSRTLSKHVEEVVKFQLFRQNISCEARQSKCHHGGFKKYILMQNN